MLTSPTQAARDLRVQDLYVDAERERLIAANTAAHSSDPTFPLRHPAGAVSVAVGASRYLCRAARRSVARQSISSVTR